MNFDELSDNEGANKKPPSAWRGPVPATGKMGGGVVIKVKIPFGCSDQDFEGGQMTLYQTSFLSVALQAEPEVYGVVEPGGLIQKFIDAKKITLLLRSPEDGPLISSGLVRRKTGTASVFWQWRLQRQGLIFRVYGDVQNPRVEASKKRAANWTVTAPFRSNASRNPNLFCLVSGARSRLHRVIEVFPKLPPPGNGLGAFLPKKEPVYSWYQPSKAWPPTPGWSRIGQRQTLRNGILFTLGLFIVIFALARSFPVPGDHALACANLWESGGSRNRQAIGVQFTGGALGRNGYLRFGYHALYSGIRFIVQLNGLELSPRLSSLR